MSEVRPEAIVAALAPATMRHLLDDNFVDARHIHFVGPEDSSVYYAGARKEVVLSHPDYQPALEKIFTANLKKTLLVHTARLRAPRPITRPPDDGNPLKSRGKGRRSMRPAAINGSSYPLFTRLKSERNSRAMCRKKTQVRNKRIRQTKPPTPSRRSSEIPLEEDINFEDHSEKRGKAKMTPKIEEDPDLVDDSKERGETKEIRKKRERTQSTEALNISQEKKKPKADTAVEVLDKPEVGVTKSVVPLKIVNRTGSAEFGDLYKSEEGEVLYKFIRKSGSDPYIIYLAGEQDNRLYKYDIQAKKIEVHPLSKFHEMTILSDDNVRIAKSLLLGDSTPEKEMELEIDKVNKKGVEEISESLNTYIYAKKSLKALQEEDDTRIDLGPDSNYGRILKRSVQAIRDKYGLEIDYVAAVQKDTSAGTRARDRLNSVKLYHPTQRWNDNKNKNISETAKLAAIHLMSNDEGVQKTINRVATNHHKGYSISTIREAYASAICAGTGNINLIRGLAEARLRYSPITYGSDIYLAVKNDNQLRPEKKETKEWGLFNTLIHEALHSVEHPNFTSFLKKYITPGLQDYIKEGIVDYLTSQIWIDALKKVEVSTSRKRISPSNRDFNMRLQINEETKNKYNDKYFAYEDQVRMVKELIDKLDAGDERLISAYFGGNLGAFLPKLKDTEEKKI